jgi:hypothetical protein
MQRLQQLLYELDCVCLLLQFNKCAAEVACQAVSQQRQQDWVFTQHGKLLTVDI